MYIFIVKTLSKHCLNVSILQKIKYSILNSSPSIGKMGHETFAQ